MASVEEHFRSVYTTPFRAPGGGDPPQGQDGGNYASELGELPVDLSHGDDPQKAAAAAVAAQRVKEYLSGLGSSPAAHFARVRTQSFQLPALTPGAGALVPRYLVEADSPLAEESATQSVADPGTAAIINYLLAQVACLTAAINGASIGVVCNGDGTVTVTLTWGASC